MCLQKKGLSIIITLYIVLQVFVLVEGLYQIEVIVFGYNNPTGRCQGCGRSRGCCDRPSEASCSDGELCDSFFTYCLRTLGSTGRGCNYPGNRRSVLNKNDGPLNFSQNMVLGLENPIILQGLTDTYMGVQLHVEITDDDSNNADDLIDVLLVDHDLQIGESSSRQTYTGIYDIHFVTMDLSITARCVMNFQGPDCSRCLHGFAGMMCNVRINECNCSGHGQCFDGVPSLTCNCDPGFTGMECEIDIDECVGVNCSGNGQCVDGTNSFTCNCNASFTGPLCESTQISASDSEGRATATLLGGIIGAILSSTLLLALLIVTVMFIMFYKKHKVCFQAKKERGVVSSGQSGTTNTTHHGKPNVSVRYIKPSSHQVQNTEEEETRIFDNTIYGTDNDEVNGGVKTEHMDQSILISVSLPDHKFDNPIYATEETENDYSTITDASAHKGETNNELQTTYESIDDGQLPSSYRPLVSGAFGKYC